MQQVPAETWAAFERRLDRARVPAPQRPDYHKWGRFYLDFCHKYGHPPGAATSLAPFLTKLAAKNQSVAQRSQASAAVRLFTQADPEVGAALPPIPAAPSPTPRATVSCESLIPGQTLRAPSSTLPSPAARAAAPSAPPPPEPRRPPGPPRATGQDRPIAPVPQSDADLSAVPGAAPTRPAAPGRGASWEQEYRDLEAAIRLRNYSTRTLEAYRFWLAKFQAFVRSRPTGELGGQEVRGFLSDLAVRQGVAASTQNQAFNALLFFYRHVVGREFGQLDGVVRAKRHRYVPVVLSRSEVEAVLGCLEPPYRLVGLLLYGCGLRLAECVGLRVQCFNLDAMLLTVHDGKGQKDRTVPLPGRALPEIREQMDRVRRLHAEDLAAGYAGVFLPRQLEKKYKNAGREFIWQWFFPAPTLTWIARTRERRRYHLHDSHVQGAVKQAAARAGIPKRVSPHTFRHTYASHLLLANYDLQTIQRLLGHSDIKTTMIYLQTVPSVTLKEAKSPLDCL
jgi:integron integrase